jgi:DNA-binding GntR family transcriptional regulator
MELAKSLGVSETPVRETLIRLQHKGLVEVVPRAEYRVRVFEPRDIEEIYELREALECFAVKNAAQHMPDEDLQYLQKLLDEAGKALDRGEISPSVQADIEFHARIVASGGNSRIVSLLTDLRDQIQIFRNLGARTPDVPRLFLRLHQRILAALMVRESDTAQCLMSEHMRLAKEQALHDYLSQRMTDSR